MDAVSAASCDASELDLGLASWSSMARRLPWSLAGGVARSATADARLGESEGEGMGAGTGADGAGESVTPPSVGPSTSALGRASWVGDASEVEGGRAWAGDAAKTGGSSAPVGIS